MSRCFILFCTTIALVLATRPAAAQWTAVTGVKTSIIWSVWAEGDTVVAGADNVTYTSFDRGTTWTTSAPVTSDSLRIAAVLFRNGRLYAGVFGRGVFVSDDRGASWSSFNQGLVGGFAESQLDIVEFALLDHHLIAATSGSGAWIRDLDGGTWGPFGNAFEVYQGANMNGVAAGGTRLLATGGFNGIAFRRDPGDPDWTPTPLNNSGFAPGLAPLTPIWSGRRWVVGAGTGVFHSPTGLEPWTFVDPGLGLLLAVSFARDGETLYSSFDPGGASFVEVSRDDGQSWELLDVESGTLTLKLAFAHGTLYAARVDGLWRRPVGTVSVEPAAVPSRFRLAVADPLASGNTIRFRIDSTEPGPAVLELFDVQGRRAAEPVRWALGTGGNDIVMDARGLRPGVYVASATAGARHATARVVRLR